MALALAITLSRSTRHCLGGAAKSSKKQQHWQQQQKAARVGQVCCPSLLFILSLMRPQCVALMLGPMANCLALLWPTIVKSLRGPRLHPQQLRTFAQREILSP